MGVRISAALARPHEKAAAEFWNKYFASNLICRPLVLFQRRRHSVRDIASHPWFSTGGHPSIILEQPARWRALCKRLRIGCEEMLRKRLGAVLSCAKEQALREGISWHYIEWWNECFSRRRGLAWLQSRCCWRGALSRAAKVRAAWRHALAGQSGKLGPGGRSEGRSFHADRSQARLQRRAPCKVPLASWLDT